MRDKYNLLSDAQSRTNPTSTGTVSTNILDLEQNSAATTLITDDQAVGGYMNVVITSAALTSGGTEGMVLEVRNGDNSDCTTGAENIGVQDVPLAEIVTGAKFSVPFRRDVCERYLGGWLRAKSTTYTGTIIVDAWMDSEPITKNDHVQKVPA